MDMRNEVSKIQNFHPLSPEHLCNGMRENCNPVGFVKTMYTRMVEGPAFQIEPLYPRRAGVREEEIDVFSYVQAGCEIMATSSETQCTIAKW